MRARVGRQGLDISANVITLFIFFETASGGKDSTVLANVITLFFFKKKGLRGRVWREGLDSSGACDDAPQRAGTQFTTSVTGTQVQILTLRLNAEHDYGLEVRSAFCVSLCTFVQVKLVICYTLVYRRCAAPSASVFVLLY